MIGGWPGGIDVQEIRSPERKTPAQDGTGSGPLRSVRQEGQADENRMLRPVDLRCEDNYILFSYARNSCHRNHRRYTLCGYHHTEGHTGDWRNCEECKPIETEMYVWYGTNEYNFVKLENPPKYEPTRCAKCNRVIKLAEEPYSTQGGKTYCERCAAGS